MANLYALEFVLRCGRLISAFRSIPLAISIAAICLLSGPAVAQTTIINFDDGVDGNLVNNAYASQGVQFSAGTKWAGLGGLTGGVGLGIVTGNAQPKLASPLTAIFNSGMNSVSLRALSVGQYGIQMRAFDALVGGTQLDITAPFYGPAGDSTSTFVDLSVGTSALTGIRRIEVYQLDNDTGLDGVAFDQLQATAVPEPGSIWLFLPALGLLRVVSRRSARSRQ